MSKNLDPLRFLKKRTSVTPQKNRRIQDSQQSISESLADQSSQISNVERHLQK
jgi:hypothetical protein